MFYCGLCSNHVFVHTPLARGPANNHLRGSGVLSVHQLHPCIRRIHFRGAITIACVIRELGCIRLGLVDRRSDAIRGRTWGMRLLVLRNGFLIDRVAVIHVGRRVGVESSRALSARVPTAAVGKYADGGLGGEMWRGLDFQRRIRSRVADVSYLRSASQRHRLLWQQGSPCAVSLVL